MKIGICMFMTDYSMTPQALARAVEERGFESLWVPEHSHIPIPRVSPWGGGDELPKQYYDVIDPVRGLVCRRCGHNFVEAGHRDLPGCAARSHSIGKGSCQSLDMVSQGRFIFGVGGGWNAEEIANHGTAFKTRFKLMRERIEAMKVIWTEDKPEYHGEFVNFGTMMTWPKPVQKPHPPIVVGGGFPARGTAARDCLR